MLTIFSFPLLSLLIQAKIEERLLRPYLLRRADYAKDVRE